MEITYQIQNPPLAVEMTVSVAHLPTLKHPFSWFKCARASLPLSVTDHHLTAGGLTARRREIQLSTVKGAYLKYTFNCTLRREFTFECKFVRFLSDKYIKSQLKAVIFSFKETRQVIFQKASARLII